ncbi:unnamed protein product [Leuciscus chuanchicus]
MCHLKPVTKKKSEKKVKRLCESVLQLMLDTEKMCGRGMICQLEVYGNRPSIKETEKHKSELRRSTGGGKHKWHKWGRRPGRKAHCPEMRRNRARPSRWSTTVVSLRPANVQGNRAPGMRAPRNTNQFLMHEKYQMMHMRSDSVGTDSGSDCEMDFADMDSYLGVLENARGALLDIPDLPSPPTFYARQMKQCQPFPFFGFDQEDSMQYFPSEDDVMQSEGFMQRDFKEFCDTVAPCI